MRKKEYLLIGIGITIVALLFVWSRSERLTTAQGLARAMRASGAVASELRISGWSRLPDANLDDSEILALAEAGMAGLGIDSGRYKLSYGLDRQGRSVRAEAAEGDFYLAVTARSSKVGAGEDREAYLVITLRLTGENPASGDWNDKITAVLSRGGDSPQITTCLVGWLGGKLEKDQWLERLESSSGALRAVTHDRLVGPDYVSVTCFSPLLPGWVRAGDKQVNLNMAVRFSPYDNRTYVVAGSPVIIGEY
ncbi:MAG: YwmB family TATA-box binding protein [Negativicutes bacterium]|nr:YwmB family TATA-box binding protein [Negativicutes bacterium]